MPWVAWTLSEEGPPLPRHPDARLTPRGRALPCERVGGGMRVSDAAAMAGEPRARGMGHGHARPFGPRQNGKAGRVNRTLAREWQYARVWESEGARASALPPHRALQSGPSARRVRGPAPMSRIAGVDNVLAHNSYRLTPTRWRRFCRPVIPVASSFRRRLEPSAAR